MNCSCAISVDTHSDATDFYKERIVKARKQHTCYECRRSIIPGERYAYTSGLWDGRFDTFKVCADCQSLIKQFFPNGWFFGMVWDMIYSFLHDAQEISSDCIRALTPTARAKVCDLLDEINKKE